jgi:hypothetical protein
MYALVENQTVVEFPIHDLGARFPQTSFPEGIPDEALPDGIFRVVQGVKPPHNPDVERVVAGSPILMDGQWVQPHIVVPLSPEEIAANEAVVAHNVRAVRNSLLMECDWTQAADSPVDKAAWAAYRQVLRDIPAQEGFPKTVNWPSKPE